MKTPQKAVGASGAGRAILFPYFLFKAQLKPIERHWWQIRNAARLAFSDFTGKRGLHA
jgi:hypothetical protein